MQIDFVGFQKKSDALLLKESIGKLFCGDEYKDFSIVISLVTKSQMLNLQRQFNNKDYVTDVLSFPVPEMEKNFAHTKNILGDLVICFEQANKQASEFGHSLLEEIIVLCAHGLFHLLGYDHERSEDEAMKQMQAEMHLLEQAGFRPELSIIGRSEILNKS